MTRRNQAKEMISHSVIEIKGIDEDAREIEGIASTPTPDRVGDIMEPKGAQFSLPLPVLWQHDHRQPIGEVTSATATPKGIRVKIKLAKPEDGDPPALRYRLDEAWTSVKKGLVRGLSIGFRALERAWLESGGAHIHKWEWYELSLVTIPANAEASVLRVKNFDNAQRAAIGARLGRTILSPGATGAKDHRHKEEINPMKTYAERIAALEAARKSAAEQLDAIQTKALDEGRSKSEAERESFAELQDQIADIDRELSDIKALEAINVQKSATEVSGNKSADAAKSRNGERSPSPAFSTGIPDLPKGIGFARYVRCKALAKLSGNSPIELAKQFYPDDPRIEKMVKAAVGAAQTGDTDWGGAIATAQDLGGEFIEFLRPRTIVGQFGIDGRPALRPVPFNVKVNRMKTGQSGYWVGEGKPAPLTAGAFDQVTMGKTKVGAITVMTKEQLRFQPGSSDQAIRDDLADAVIERMDIDFIDPAKAAVAGGSPASILNGLTPIASGTGTDAESVRADLQALFKKFTAANIKLSGVVLIMSEEHATALMFMRNALGIREFPEMADGMLEMRHLIISNNVKPGDVIGVSASDIMLADDGEVDIDMSDQVALEMKDSSLTQDATDGTGVSMVSMWQTGGVAMKAERFVNWQKARGDAAAYIGNADWGGATAS